MFKLTGLIAAVLVTFALSPAHAVEAGAMPPTAVPAAPPASAPSAQPQAQAAVPAQSGIEVIKNFYIQLADAMKQGDQLGFAGRYKKLEPAVKTAFNLPLMTKFAVGLDWAKATPEEQRALTSAFSDFSVATYASEFKTYNGEIFRIVDEKKTADGVMVETQLTPKDHAPVALNYLIKPDEQGKLRIVDVLLDGAISQLAARRSEFTSIVHRDGIAALVTSLGDKTKQMGPS